MRFKLWLEATTPYSEKKIDPALLTFSEFWKLVNPSSKQHSSSAYDWSLEKMTDKKAKYPNLLFRRVINGKSFEFRSNKRDRYAPNTFVKTDQNGDIVRINGEVQYYTVEELHRLNFRRYEYEFAVFDKEQQVAATQDEWGCLLVGVAHEYRGFGLGPIITKLAWEAEPGKDTGGCTPRGEALTYKVHSEFVKDYLQKGFYSLLVKEGKLTTDRVKKIIASADLKTKPKEVRNLNFDDPNDWLLYAEDGAFVMYDKKLKDLLDEGDEEENWHWITQCIKAMAFVGSDYFGKQYMLHHLGGESPQLRKFMMYLAASWTAEEGDKLRIFDDDLDAVDDSKMKLKDRLVTLTVKPLAYNGLALAEKRWRKTFDRYDEFKVRLLELTEQKYRKAA